VEIMMIMVVISIVIGGSIFLLSNDPSDKIQTLPSEIEQLAKTSLAKAKLDKRTQYILISPKYIWRSSDSEQTEPPSDSLTQIKLPTDCSIGYKRSGDAQWHWAKTKADKGIWTFSVAGICEQVSIIIKLNDSSAEISFHPLTAAIIEK
jgi:hypothetical protein